MVPVSLTWMQLGALSSRAKASCFSSPGAPIEFDAEADGGEALGIVELVVDAPRRPPVDPRGRANSSGVTGMNE